MQGKTQEVSVLLNYEQARLEGVDLATVRDRFQVVAVGIENPTREGLTELWTNAGPSCVSKITLKCKFVSPSLVKTSAAETSPSAGDVSASGAANFLSPGGGGGASDKAASGTPGSAVATSASSPPSSSSSAVLPPTISVIGAPPQLTKESLENLELTRSGDTGGGSSPTLEEAKDRFKSEMSLTKLKRDVSALREEKSAVEGRLQERDKKLLDLEEELARLRRMMTTPSTIEAKPRIPAMEAVTWILLFFVFLVVVYAVLGIDVLGYLSPTLSVGRVVKKVSAAAGAFLKE